MVRGFLVNGPFSKQILKGTSFVSVDKANARVGFDVVLLSAEFQTLAPNHVMLKSGVYLADGHLRYDKIY